MSNLEDYYFDILELFYEKGVESVTPTYVAYVLRISPEQASELLDEMVRSSMLDLQTDAEGHLQYTLPETEKQRIQKEDFEPRERNIRREQSSPKEDARSADMDGRDGSLEGASREVSPREDQRSTPPKRPAKPANRAPQGRGRERQGRPKKERTSRSEPESSDVRLEKWKSKKPAKSDEGSPVLAALLSLVFPGMGQVYNQEVGKGLLMFVSWFFGWIFLLFWVVNIWSSFDAYQVAQHRRLAEE